ncbi:MAG: hypothetical protein SGI74_13185 [Oligoflexia bacterium]|nr:hypothetical protein [Oligoflexia bacterium]
MDNTKLVKQMKRFEGCLMVDRGLSKVTAGFQSHMAKPVEPQSLARAIVKLAGQQQ